MIGYQTIEEAQQAVEELGMFGLAAHADQDVERFGNQWIIIVDGPKED